MRVKFRLGLLFAGLLAFCGADWTITTFQSQIFPANSFDVGGGAPANGGAYSIRFVLKYDLVDQNVLVSHGGTVDGMVTNWSKDFDPSNDINTSPHQWPLGDFDYVLYAGTTFKAKEHGEVKTPP